jgi:hypothetical protein
LALGRVVGYELACCKLTINYTEKTQVIFDIPKKTIRPSPIHYHPQSCISRETLDG